MKNILLNIKFVYNRNKSNKHYYFYYLNIFIWLKNEK